MSFSLHPLQKNILAHLVRQPVGLRYRDMKPADIENDLYNYHLQQLVREQLVEKDEQGYRLSRLGKAHMLDQQPVDPVGQTTDRFKVAALALVVRQGEAGREVLYQTRTCAPFAGNQEIIGGSIRKGEPVIEAAKRRLFEEAGLVAEFRCVGTVRKIRYDQSGQLYADVLYQVCVADRYSGELQVETTFGRHDWLSLEAAIKHEATANYGSSQLANVFQEWQRTGQLSPFYIEEVYHQDIY